MVRIFKKCDNLLFKIDMNWNIEEVDKSFAKNTFNHNATIMKSWNRRLKGLSLNSETRCRGSIPRRNKAAQKNG